jgi:hypothetical protein
MHRRVGRDAVARATAATRAASANRREADTSRAWSALAPARPSAPADPNESTDPADPTDSTDPADPIDRNDPADATEKHEPNDANDHAEANDRAERWLNALSAERDDRYEAMGER